jgi:protein-arginine kinase activator protein McsA
MNNKVKKSQLQTDYLCNICNKFYASQSSLCHHNKKFHNNNILKSSDNILKSSDNILKSSDNILKSSDNILKSYNCRKCNKTFKNIKTRCLMKKYVK